MKRAKKAQAKDHASGKVSPPANRVNGGESSQPRESHGYSEDVPLSPQGSGHFGDVAPMDLPHRPIEAQTGVVDSSSTVESPIIDVTPLDHPVSPTSPSHYFQFHTQSDREEHTPFLLVDDNAINMKVRSHPSSRHHFLGTDASTVLRCLHRT